jgi:glycosyltransferase involved in cell wall biosynthesis
MTRRIRSILFTPISPFSTDSGGAQRTALLHQALACLGEVDVVLIQTGTFESVERSDEIGIVARCTWVPGALNADRYRSNSRVTADLAALLPIPLGQYDLAVGRYLGAIAKIELPKALPTLVDLDDFMPKLWEGALTISDLKQFMKSMVIRLLSQHALRRFDRFFFVTQRDLTRFGGRKGSLLPNIPWSFNPAPVFGKGDLRILFVGSMWYAPNAAAMDRFIGSAWPVIRQRFPGVELMIVGAAAPEIRQRWSSHPGVSAPGFVDDLAQCYKSAAVVIAPIRTGGGSNIKVLEAMAWGKPVVASDYCYRAFADVLTEGEHLAVAITDRDFADRCIELLANAELRADLARRGHSRISECFSRERFNRIVEAEATRILERFDRKRHGRMPTGSAGA